MAFIRKVKTASGATAVQVVSKQSGKITKLIHIGSAHTEAELNALLSLATHEIVGAQQSLFGVDTALQVRLKDTASTLLYDALKAQYHQIGFDQLNDEDFAHLCIARIVEPVSKLDSIRVLHDLGIRGVKKNQLYRCLTKIVDKDYRRQVADVCFAHAATQGISLLLYDVTTLYFEIQKEDDYRKPGMSKERRLEPQIVIGLLVDQDGFPLALHSFEGNTAETKTILPVIEAFKSRHKLADITVVADAGMLSTHNLEALTRAGYHYIVGSRIRKVPYDIAEYRKTSELTDKSIITVGLAHHQRIIYQYRAKRAQLDLHNIDKQVAKAQRITEGKTPLKRTKFLTLTLGERKLDQAAIDKARALAGIKGYVTNLEVSDDQVVINHYHQLWQVEASFRMSKSDLRARPIFHHKRDSIEAHLTIVFASLAISRKIERLTRISIKQFVHTLRPIRSGIITIGTQEYPATPDITPPISSLLEKLRLGH